MRKTAIILDLDNTIYPVSSIGETLFKSLFEAILESGEYTGDFNEIKAEIMRRPFQFVADDFKFSKLLKEQGTAMLAETTYEGEMKPFNDYIYFKEIHCRKFLVTTGFIKMQQSKIRQLGVRHDFEDIIIIDPLGSGSTKTDIFRNILVEKQLKPEEVLVVGDDLNSEIRASRELGIDSVLYDYARMHSQIQNQTVISDFSELKAFMKQ